MNEGTSSMQMLLMEDALDPATPLVLPRGVRALYLRGGQAMIGAQALQADDALFSEDAITVSGSGTLWRFEVAHRAPDWQPAPEDRSRLLLAHPLRRDPAQPFVLRLDRVSFTPDAETPRHGHFGQGIRRLIDGRLLMTIGDRVLRRQAGETWFETGEDPVTARGLLPDTAFIRAMVMDGDMKGQSSFRAWTPADETRPRRVTYKLYLDEVTRLG